jgi:hypothetical protein
MGPFFNRKYHKRYIFRIMTNRLVRRMMEMARDWRAVRLQPIGGQPLS